MHRVGPPCAGAFRMTWTFITRRHRAYFLRGGLLMVLLSRAAAADTTPPTVPTGLTVTGVTFNHVSLAWTASTDDTGVTGYLITRTWPAGSASFTVAGNITTFT